MSKNTLISTKLFTDVLRLIYFLVGEDIPDEARKLCISIETELSDKIRRKQIRDVFTAYKTSPPGSERESLRLEYVRLTQIHKSFTSKNEVPYSSI